ncbi:MAG: BrxA/BrxB family bacilliredoxin [Armatimonadetes bacterium]|nr:BrxA/BrxB family bacilliredoxin [Armatimonadota bacterium]
MFRLFGTSAHTTPVEAMREELADAGFKELRTPSDVDAALSDQMGTILLVLNSVCGCAAGSARPGVVASLKHPKRPAKLLTVFAGQDREATARARSYFPEIEPSSPSAVLFRDGTLCYVLHRHEIEGRSPDEVADRLQAAYEAYCG